MQFRKQLEASRLRRAWRAEKEEFALSNEFVLAQVFEALEDSLTSEVPP